MSAAKPTPSPTSKSEYKRARLPRRDDLLEEPAFLNFGALPDCAFVDARVVCPLYGISPATLWRHISRGLVPQPVKLSSRSTRWRVGDLRKHLRQLAGEE